MNDLSIKTGFDISDGLKSLNKLQVELNKVLDNVTFDVDISQDSIKSIKTQFSKLSKDVQNEFVSNTISIPKIDTASVKQGLKGAFETIDKKAKKTAESVAKEFTQRLRDSKGRFVKVGNEVGEELGKGINDGVNSLLDLEIAEVLGGQLGNVGGIFQDLSRQSLEFETSLGLLKTAAQGNAETFDRLESSAINIYNSGIGESFDEVARAVSNANMQLDGLFLDDSGIETFTQGALRLSETFETDVNEIIGKSRTFIQEFGLEGQESLNLVSLALRDAANFDEDVLDTFNEFSGVAREAGFSAEQFTGTLIEGVKSGARNTDLLGNAILEAGIRLNDLSASKTIQEIGGETSQVVNDILKLGETGAITVKETLKRANTAINKAYDDGKIGNSIRQQMQVAISGTPAEDLGADLYSRLFTQDINSNEIREKASEASKVMKDAFVTDAFAPITRTFESMFNSLSSAATPLLSITGNLLSTFGQFAPALQLFSSNIGSIKAFATTLIGTLVPSFTTAGTVGTAAGTSIAASWGAALAPFLAVGAAIAALIGAFVLAYKKIEPFRNFIDELVNNIKVFVATIVKKAKPVISQLVELLSEIADFIGNVIVAAFKAFTNVITLPISLIGKLIKSLGIFKESGKETFSILESVNTAFKGLQFVIESTRVIISGITNAFDVIVTSIGDFIDALSSFNISQALKAFAGFGDKVGSAFKDGVESKLSEIELGKASKELSDNIDKTIEELKTKGKDFNLEQLRQSKAQIEEQIKQANQDGKLLIEDRDKLYNKLNKVYGVYLDRIRKQNEDNNKIIENQDKASNARTIEKRKKAFTEYQNFLKSQQQKNTELIKELNKNELDEQIKSLEINNEKLLESENSLQSRRLEKILENDKKIYELRTKKEIEAIKEKFNVRLSKEQEAFKKVIENEKVSNGEKTKAYEVFQDNLALIEIKKNQELRAKRTQLDNSYFSERRKKEKQLNESILSERENLELQRIELIDDIAEKERETSLFEAKKTYKEKLQLANGNNQLELRAFIEYQEDKRKIEQRYILENASLRKKTILNLSNNLQSAFDDVQLFNTQTNVNSNLIENLEEEEKLLEDSLNNRTITYEQYLSKMSDIGKQRAEAEREAQRQTIINYDELLKGFSNAIESVNNDLSKSFGINIDSAKTAYDRIFALKKELATNNELTLEQTTAITQEITDLNQQASDAIGVSWSTVGASIGLVFTQMLADGKSFTKSLALAVLEGVKATVKILSVQILAKQYAQKGLLGAIPAGIMIGLVQAALSVAGQAVENIPFKKGGLNPYGFGQSGLVKGHTIEYAEGNNPEFIFNAKTTRKNLKEFQEINRRNLSLSEYFDTKGINKRLDNVEQAVIGVSKELKTAKLFEENRYYNVNVKNEIKETVRNYR